MKPNHFTDFEVVKKLLAEEKNGEVIRAVQATEPTLAIVAESGPLPGAEWLSAWRSQFTDSRLNVHPRNLIAFAMIVEGSPTTVPHCLY